MSILIDHSKDIWLRGACREGRKGTFGLLNAGGLRTAPLSQEIAQEAAKLRATHDLRPPDAIQLSTATSEGASFFLINDSRLPSLPSVQMLVLDQLREQL